MSARTAARQGHGRLRRGRPGAAGPRAVTSCCPAYLRLDGRPEIKTTIRPEQVSTRQMDDWPAGLPDGERSGHAEPAGPGYAVPASYGHGLPASPGHAKPAGYVRARPAGPGYAVPAGYGRAEPADGRAWPQAPAGPVAPAAPAAAAAPAGPAGSPARAVIGDQLRLPVMWCEMGSCISSHSDPAALGEADTRARAIEAGWRIDALGRLACPRCQQANAGFRTSGQVVPWDRHTALARTARASRAAVRTSCTPGRAVSGYPPASRAELERDHDFGAARARPAGQRAERPASASLPAVRC